MNDYAEAINRSIEEHHEQLRTYGGFLAEMGIARSELVSTAANADHIRQGYDRQLAAYPNH